MQLAPAAARAGAIFTGLGLLPAGTPTEAWGVSGDGSTAVGGSVARLGYEAIRWTASGGLAGLGFMPGGSASNAQAISGDGSTVVGFGLNSANQGEAFRWTASGGMVGLGFLPGGTVSGAYGVSADGTTVVGYSQNGSDTQAIRWTALGGMVGLGALPGWNYSNALGASADGSVIVGWGNRNPNGDLDYYLPPEAFRWTSAGGIEGLGFLPGQTDSFAAGVSADGSTIAGRSGTEAFRWTASEGMIGLGVVPGWISSLPWSMSADGSTIVGTGADSAGVRRAFIWDAVHGMRDLSAVLSAEGADLSNWVLTDATAVSDDGRTIVGFGTDPTGQTQAWIAMLPEPGTDALLLASLLGLAAARRRGR